MEPPPEIPRFRTQPEMRQLSVGRLPVLRTFTPPTPKTARPISPKEDTSFGYFGLLPAEIIMEIFGFLSFVDLGRMSQTRKKFKDFAEEKLLAYKKHVQALKILRESIPICIGFSSQSLKGVLENRRRLNPKILELKGEDYIRACQSCEFVQKAAIDQNGYICALSVRERFNDFKGIVLAKDPATPKLINFFPHEARNEFKIISVWESAKFKTKGIDDAEVSDPRSLKSRINESSPFSPKSRSTWKLVRLEFRGENLKPSQIKVIEKVLRELNQRNISDMIIKKGELSFSESQEYF